MLLMFSCESKTSNHEKILRNNLYDFEIVKDKLIKKYTNKKILFSSYKTKSILDKKTIYADQFLSDAVEKYKINDIELTISINAGKENYLLEFFIDDNNIRYLYSSYGFANRSYFENNRIVIIPINNYWQLNYLKKEW